MNIYINGSNSLTRGISWTGIILGSTAFILGIIANQGLIGARLHEYAITLMRAGMGTSVTSGLYLFLRKRESFALINPIPPLMTRNNNLILDFENQEYTIPIHTSIPMNGYTQKRAWVIKNDENNTYTLAYAIEEELGEGLSPLERTKIDRAYGRNQIQLLPVATSYTQNNPNDLSKMAIEILRLQREGYTFPEEHPKPFNKAEAYDRMNAVIPHQN